MKHCRITFLLSALSLMVLMLFVTAEQAGAQTDRPCAEDLAKYCRSVSPGSGRLLECYEQNKMNMSKACVSWAEFVKSNARELKDACAKEIESSCKGRTGDPLGMIDCIQSNYIDLSPKCVQELNQFKNFHPMPVQ